jgi:hypothetical protein
MRITLHAGIALALIAGPAFAGTFTEIDIVSGQATSISHNGRIVGGIAGASAWRWAKGRGSEVIDGFTSTNGMSSWGQPVAGSATDGNGNEVAAIAYSNSNFVGPTLIGAYPGGIGFDTSLSTAYDTSDNGVAVGLAYDAASNAIAFRWSAAEGMTRLTVNRPASYSRANGISPDGSAIYGWNDQDNGNRTGVIWRNGVPLDLVDANGEGVGEALASNSDGSVVVGTGASTDLGSEAWRWTAATGVQPIGFIGFAGTASAFGVSEDGNVAVGASGFGWNRDAVVWTPATGMLLLSEYATVRGVTIPDGWRLGTATGVSADGRTISGWGFGPNGIRSFVIDLRDDTPTEAVVEAHGTVAWNDLPSGPFANVTIGTKVTMTFRISPEGAIDFDPGMATRYPIVLDSFQLRAGSASDVLVATSFGPGLLLSNDYPKSDGIHLWETPMATDGQSMEFELFNPGGDLFDSNELNRINRTFGPEFFEKASWNVTAGGEFGMYMSLDSVSINDYSNADVIFANGFD